jgi:hypothetical protein
VPFQKARKLDCFCWIIATRSYTFKIMCSCRSEEFLAYQEHRVCKGSR